MAAKTVPLITLETERLRIVPLDRAGFDEKLHAPDNDPYFGTEAFREAMEELARQREGVLHMELEFIEGNARARGLYEKAGFRIVGMHPDAIRQEDGTMCALYIMQKKL